MLVPREVKYYVDLYNLVLWVHLFYSASQVSVLHLFLAGSVCYLSYAALCAFKSQPFFLLYHGRPCRSYLHRLLEVLGDDDLSLTIIYHCWWRSLFVPWFGVLLLLLLLITVFIITGSRKACHLICTPDLDVRPKLNRSTNLGKPMRFHFHSNYNILKGGPAPRWPVYSIFKSKVLHYQTVNKHEKDWKWRETGFKNSREASDENLFPRTSFEIRCKPTVVERR